ncbi:hypothetical protein AB1A65_03025 [Muricauda sp. ANG21]|uniref:hypothetical protein n=1 Tax=Allomuricauda sp. ANG21 TaxID=3042468 RepID=UPI003451C42A
MNKYKFVEKFQDKTDSELQNIISDKKSYVEEARFASLQILKERNGNSPELETLEKELTEAKVRKTALQKQNTEEKKKKDFLTDDPDAPELHSKKVILVFSAIFSTIFGAVLLMYNMKQTNNGKGRIQVLIFGILYTILIMIIVNTLKTSFNISIILNLIGASVLNEYFWNKFIGKEFLYRKRSWIKPAIISVIITVPFILALIYGDSL